MSDAELEPHLLKTFDDLSKDWLETLLNRRGGSKVQLTRWHSEAYKPEDQLSGFCSSRLRVHIEYEVEEKGESSRNTRGETLFIKIMPDLELNAEIVRQHKFHLVEAGQYSRFHRALASFERKRRGPKAVVETLAPSHPMAAASENYLTIVLPDLTKEGYTTRTVLEGLTQEETLTVVERIGAYHGTVVAYKDVTGTDILNEFPECFVHVTEDLSSTRNFIETGFSQLRELCTSRPSWRSALDWLEPLSEIAFKTVWNNLPPEGVFGTTIHGDLQASNMFFRREIDGHIGVKLIDWANCHYTYGTLDFLYLLATSVDTHIRRQITPHVMDTYLDAFNLSLQECGSSLVYSRQDLDYELAISRRLAIIFLISTVNLFFSSDVMKERLYAIVTDLAKDADL